MFFTTVLCVCIFVICTTLSQKLDHPLDITTLVKQDYDKTVVVAQGDARGLPLRRGRSFLNATYAGHRCCQDWTREGWTKLDIETALDLNTPLDPGTTGSFDGTEYEADRLDRLSTIFYGIRKTFWEWDSNSKSAVLPVDGRVRLSFRLSNQTSTVQLYLCEPIDAQEEADTECVAFLLSGYDSQRSFLHYQALHLSSESGTGPEIDTPFGELQSTLIHKNESAPQLWMANYTYNFTVERTYDDNFEVRLDGADLQQKRLMTIKANPKMDTFFAIVTPSDSSSYLQVVADPTWCGYLRPGGRMWIEFKTLEDQLGEELGVFMCTDRFQEKCVGEIISGVSKDGIRYIARNYSQHESSDIKYWVAGTHGKTYHGKEISRNHNVEARWDKGLKNRAQTNHIFSVSRYDNGSVQVKHNDLEDSKSSVFNVPKEYKHIFIASYQNKGKVLAFASNGFRCNGPASCIAPAPVWVLRKAKGELRSPTLPASVARARVCVMIVARITPGSKITVTMQERSGQLKVKMGPVLSKGSEEKAEWIIKRLVAGTHRDLKNKPLEIVVNVMQSARNPKPVMVQWVSFCNAEDGEDVYEQNSSEELYSTDNELGYNVLIKQPKTEQNPVCRHGGQMNMDSKKCECAPGFSGTVCDHGCGEDSFGVFCLGKCSRALPGSECKGVKLCSPSVKCDCAPGFGGSSCTQECAPGRYGISCRELCGHCKDSVPCNRYTGRCQDGCRGALQPPYCKEECGRSLSALPKIIHGDNAEAEHHPWHAGVYELKYEKKGDPSDSESLEQICGASLVKPKILISAAHCFYYNGEQKPAQNYKVALGKNYREWDDSQEKPPQRVQRRDVYWLHVHDSFRGDSGAFNDDIALIELSEPVLTTEYVAPICLDWTGGFDSVLNSRSGTVVGWGKTDGHSSRQLRVATLPYLGSQECLVINGENSFAKYINKDKFCAGENEQGFQVSSGDSGGGFVFKNPGTDGAWFLRGIVSVAPPQNQEIAVFTNVTSYLKWLSLLKDQIDIRSFFLTKELQNLSSR